MKLTSLLAHFPEYGLTTCLPQGNPDILAITSDSRTVVPGALFVAVGGGTIDGHRFIPDALQRGAVAIVGQQAQPDFRASNGDSIPYIQVEDSRLALAIIAAGLQEFPARQLTVIGVTGTDGKTTTSNLIYQILRAADIRCGMISTVNAMIGDKAFDTGFHVTTPDAPVVQGYLRQMVNSGLTHVVLEATSHGLAQSRVAACDFDLGVVTNITHEHLDYHGSFDAYRQAKSRLFSGLANTPGKAHQPPRAGVLNADDDSYDYLASVTQVPVLSYGEKTGDVRVDKVSERQEGRPAGGIALDITGRDLRGEQFSLHVNSKLVGAFNMHNILAAVTLAKGALSLPDAVVQEGIEMMPGIPGRMELISLGQNFTAIVDFAHTPNALRRALQAARQMTSGRVIAVFGSAGLRDRRKRWMMAETAAELADLIVLTAEDPRTESLDAILAEMAAGAGSRGRVENRDFWRIPDRGQAIRFAIDLARPGDLVITCGKGHEQSMCFEETEYYWDDRLAMRAALAAHLGIQGPPIPYLPTQA